MIPALPLLVPEPGVRRSMRVTEAPERWSARAVVKPTTPAPKTTRWVKA